MKRFVLLMLALMLILSLTTVCLAAEDAPLSVSNSQIAEGQTVYLAVTLNESVTANTIGVMCEYDKTLLTAQPSLCTWGKTGVLAAFEQDNMGAWASAEAQDLKGKLCVLAFQVKEGVAFSRTAVKCTVMLKDNAEEKGTFTAEGYVETPCDHSYGPWSGAGSLGHQRTCSLCGGKNTQAHSWDEGSSAPKPGDSNITVVTYTCQVCKETSTREVPAGAEQTAPDRPQQTEPEQENVVSTFPQTGQGSNRPEDSRPQTGEDKHGPSYRGEEASTAGTQPEHGHSHEEEAATEPSHDATEPSHDHEHAPAGGSSRANIWVIVAVLAAAIAGAVLFLKKKR